MGWFNFKVSQPINASQLGGGYGGPLGIYVSCHVSTIWPLMFNTWWINLISFWEGPYAP